MNNPSAIKKREKRVYLILLIIGLILFMVMLYIFVFGKGKYVGKWECKAYSDNKVIGDKYILTIKLNVTKSFTYGDYKELDKNSTSGKYTVTEKDGKYIIELKSDEFIVDGKKQQNYPTNKLNMEIVNGDEAIVSFDNIKAKYYCYK